MGILDTMVRARDAFAAQRRCAPWIAAAAMLAWSPAALAGEPVEGRLEVALRVPVVQDLDLTVATEVRIQDGFQRVLPELTFAWSVNRWFRADLGHRYAADRLSEGGYRHMHRLFGDARFDHEVANAVEFGYRMRMQQDWSQGETGSEWRHRLGAELTMLDVFEPGVSWEVFAPFAKDQPIELAEWRFEVALGLDFGAHDVEPYWFVSRRFRPEPPSPEHTIGLTYRYSL